MYKLDSNYVVRLFDNARIPVDEGNSDYQRYLEWTAIEGNVAEPWQTPEEALSIARMMAFHRNNDGYCKITEAVTKSYPEQEKDTWPTQQREVLKWLNDPEADTPWINTAAAARGRDRLDYLQRSYAKAQQFEQVSAYLTGFRQRYEDQIKAATTVEEIEALEFVYQLPQ